MALFQILRGKAAKLASKVFHDGYAYFTPDDGAFYIDAETDGDQKRIRINPDDYIVEQNQKNHQQIWRGTKEEYDAITTKDANTLYIVTDDDPEESDDDISLGLSGASAGQSPVIKTVDASGTPTEWEAAALAKADGSNIPSTAMSTWRNAIAALPGAKIYGKADANGKIMAYTDAACTQDVTYLTGMSLTDYGNGLLVYDHKTYQCVGFSEDSSMAGAYIVAHFARSEIVSDNGASVLNTEHAVLDVMGYLAGTVDAPITITTKSITPSAIGAAPSGYGLGDGSGKNITDANTAVNNGWYYWGENAANTPFNYGCMRVDSRATWGGRELMQTAYYFGGQPSHAAQRRLLGGTWGEWEYVNPPMALGVEYRTTERYLGKPVYCQLIKFDAAPAPGSSQTATISGALYISLQGFIDLNDYREVLPKFNDVGNADIFVINQGETVAMVATDSATDYSAYGAYIVAKYTKATD